MNRQRWRAVDEIEVVMISQLLHKQTAESGITLRYSKDYKFLLRRSRTPEGFENYALESSPRNERLVIPRELFDRFRSTLKQMVEQVAVFKDDPSLLDRKIHFKDLDIYAIRPVIGDPSRMLIQELVKQPGSTGSISFPIDALTTLVPLFYLHKLQHTNDIFDRIVRYHKLFHFSFTEGSESITSGLTLRKDVLSQIDEYIPRIGQRTGELQPRQAEGEEFESKANAQRLKGEKADAPGKFKPRLGQRDGSQGYSVDYGLLFQKDGRVADKTPKAADDQTKRGATGNSQTFPLPLLAGDIKNLVKVPFRCELSQEEAIGLRENFLQERECEYYIGFEIVDAIFRVQQRLKTYRFPLYYMKVSIEESGRFIHISPFKKSEIYLNHLALATLVESFSDGRHSGDPIEKFFETLMSQRIEVQGHRSEIKLHRLLPVAEEVFDRTRDILLGHPGENGKGGILGQLDLIGIECDLEAVALYKSSQQVSPVTRALEQDMDRIQGVAEEYPERFYRSLLGQFLTPEMKRQQGQGERFFQRPYCPGALPQSTKRIFDLLNRHNLVLLEGPPGTGKTFAIMNILLHCLNTGQRLLVVSDQKAAIHALTEKLEDYLVGKDRVSPQSKSHLALWEQAIKVVDQVPTAQASLSHWMSMLSQSLGLDVSREAAIYPEDPQVDSGIEAIDREMKQLLQRIQAAFDRQLKDGGATRRVAAKYEHPTTEQDIHDLVAFLEFCGAGRHEKKVQSEAYRRNRQLLRDFMRDRKILSQDLFIQSYHDFGVEPEAMEENLHKIDRRMKLVEMLLMRKPRRRQDFHQLLANFEEDGLLHCVYEQWQAAFPKEEGGVFKWLRWVASYLRHPSTLFWRHLAGLLLHQKNLLRTVGKLDEGGSILRQLRGVHAALHPSFKDSPPLALEAVHYTLGTATQEHDSIQGLLLKMKDGQSRRDALIKKKVLQRASRIDQLARSTDSKKGTNAITTVTNLIEALKECSSIEQGIGVSLLRDLQLALLQAFPIWICRKQAVSFLFPSREQQFDLVIIDEAGQCRVDDALPLLYRAKRLMVVGDEKQTVLNKNSVIDDYLFKDFNLEDHLRQTQARGMKGGGSHIFGLVKSIKEAEVMLDEHYRCPPDIIRYSNEYVYGSKLKIMQWQHPALPPAVVVDYSEKDARSQHKPSSGKYKDIETDVIDRFLEFVAKMVKKIEKETGRTINMETDVALCYFLLKNEPYIKDKKGEFLLKLGRGHDVLDGAGAALQGKERDYIFYLWDVNRGNMKSFRQGDDPDKRKGELNVLMSRPKIRSFHYLHPEFASLKHDTASITDYLWKAFQSQGQKKSPLAYEPRRQRPGNEFRPWQRSSGQLMQAILSKILNEKHQDPSGSWLKRLDYSVVVGDSRRKIDLMILGAHERSRSLALVDLSAFELEKSAALELADYFFQLQRAVPPIEPVFLFLHELADERSISFQYLLRVLEKIQTSSKAA